MDTDEVAEVEMAITPAPDNSHSSILSLFDPFPFTNEVIESIQARRTVMANELIFDLLLEQACIASPHSLFPPSTPDILQTLISAITLCPWDFLKKSALYFYLLSFMSPEIAQRNTSLPPHFVALARACFLLDLGDLPSLQRAVALLGDARIVQDLAPKILQTLELANEPRLVRTYVRTAQPVLQAFEDAAIYVRALLDQSLAEAWIFQRGFPEGSPVRNGLVRVILDACLMPIPNQRHLQHLLSLPLSPFESSLLQAYALSPPRELSPPIYTLLQDLITVRMLSSGKYSDAIKISKAFDVSDSQLARKYAGTPEGKALARATAERKATMRDVLNVLPAIQRRELESELNETTKTDMDKVKKASNREADEREKLSNSMTMSWEDLGISTISQRAGQLEGSPVPGMNSSGIFTGRNASRTPLNKMTASIFSDSPLSPLRTPSRTVAPPPLKPSTTLKSTITAAQSLKTIPKPTPLISQNLTQPSTSFAESLSKVTRFNKPSGPSKLKSAGRFGIEPSPTPPPLFNSSLSFRSTMARRDIQEHDGEFGERNAGPNPLFGAAKNGRRPALDELSLIDSDDPDAFVIRRRKSYTFKSPPPPRHRPSSSSPTNDKHDEEDVVTDFVPPAETPRRVPGAFSFDETEKSQKQNKSRTTRKSSAEQPSKSRSERPITRSRIQLPGSLFDDDIDEDDDELHDANEKDENREEQDDVSALPATLPPTTTTRKARGRSSAASVESGDDGEASTTVRLRRSSRLSSAEPMSPQKKKTTKRKPKESSTATRTRKRKTADA
ncbi:hypothetical protein Clacol_009316 [Clathrus columnatus]|uniref:ELYS-like domain-containing protein n=1 Tax=Clathrus columnatus TaxID=1419009 RepID=A0AAV5AQ76_9AGAM|nr:hypothetical protein Clacol_009316 [Clathrus columnatus]